MILTHYICILIQIFRKCHLSLLFISVFIIKKFIHFSCLDYLFEIILLRCHLFTEVFVKKYKKRTNLNKYLYYIVPLHGINLHPHKRFIQSTFIQALSNFLSSFLFFWLKWKCSKNSMNNIISRKTAPHNVVEEASC